jgi:hypothetical protein
MSTRILHDKNVVFGATGSIGAAVAKELAGGGRTGLSRGPKQSRSGNRCQSNQATPTERATSSCPRNSCPLLARPSDTVSTDELPSPAPGQPRVPQQKRTQEQQVR